MGKGKSQKQQEQWRSYVLSQLWVPGPSEEDINDQENIRRIRGIEPDNEGRDLGIKEYLERLKELHKQAGQ